MIAYLFCTLESPVSVYSCWCCRTTDEKQGNHTEVHTHWAEGQHYWARLWTQGPELQIQPAWQKSKVFWSKGVPQVPVDTSTYFFKRRSNALSSVQSQAPPPQCLWLALALPPSSTSDSMSYLKTETLCLKSPPCPCLSHYHHQWYPWSIDPNAAC